MARVDGRTCREYAARVPRRCRKDARPQPDPLEERASDSTGRGEESYMTLIQMIGTELESEGP
jgi:hypothetical protein